MRTVASRPQVRQEMEKGFASIDSDSLVLHTDLFRLRFTQPGTPLQRQLADLFQMIVECSAGRTLLFPAFNYDYCRTRVYSPMADPCQVGTLNEYVRQLYPHQRTLTPVFSFCIQNNRAFSLEPAENPFSERSTFGELVREGSAVVFFGASFGANTFIHHPEEVVGIGYRYPKPFPGVIRLDGDDRPIVLDYRVRPLVIGAVDYDWDRLALDLFDNGLLHQLPLGGGKLLWFRADRLLEYWCMRLLEDELYFLTELSRKKTLELYEQYGKPLRYQSIERV